MEIKFYCKCTNKIYIYIRICIDEIRLNLFTDADHTELTEILNIKTWAIVYSGPDCM